MQSTMEKKRIGNTRMVKSIAIEACETWIQHQEKKASVLAPQDVKVLEEAREQNLSWALRLEKVINAVKTGKPLQLPKAETKAPEPKAGQAKSVTVSPAQLQKMIAAGIAEAMKHNKAS